LSPLIFNVAMTALDEHVMRPWKPGGPMPTPGKRTCRRSKGAPAWRIIRCADDFVILVNGRRSHVQALREDVAAVLEPLGLRLSPAKTQVVHMSDGFGFLGFRIRWKRKRGPGKWYVCTFIADRPIRALKAKIRALTHRTSQQDLAYIVTRLGQIMRGWANYFKYAVAKWTFSKRTPSPGGGGPACCGPATDGTGASSAATSSPLTGDGGSRRMGPGTSGSRA
jgi:RNA-directed DNA polymerase